MRCLACDCVLTDQEATRKNSSGEWYVELCNDCYSGSDVDWYLANEEASYLPVEGTNEQTNEDI